MTLVEIYNMCRLLFPDKEIEYNGKCIHIIWHVKSTYIYSTDRHIWISDYGGYIMIESNLIRLPSWFKKIVKYETNKSERKVFIGFKV